MRSEKEEPLESQKTAKKSRKKKKKPVLLIIILIAGICVMSVAGFMIVKTLLEYKKSADEYKDLRKYTTENTGNEALTAVSASSGAETADAPPISVDFNALKAVNSDITGWLYIEGIDVSYPVVHGEDNSFYLHHTVEKTYNFSGSLFTETKNKGDFSDPNTIIYGHNMLDLSMFGKLRHLETDKIYETDPYFWVLTPSGNYKYRMFSMHVTTADSSVYTLFNGTDKTFTDWCQEMKGESDVDLGNRKFTTYSKIVTLSTCVDNSLERFIVQGVRIE